MSSDKMHMTQKGFDKLKKELDNLKTVKRRQLSQEIGQARLHGDISENSEYDAAKEAQGLNEKKIAELEDKLAMAHIINPDEIPSDRVLFGAKVKLLEMDSKKEFDYMLVSEIEADFTSGMIAITSPVGKALMGHRENEVVEVKLPKGIVKYKILKISR